VNEALVRHLFLMAIGYVVAAKAAETLFFLFSLLQLQIKFGNLNLARLFEQVSGIVWNPGQMIFILGALMLFPVWLTAVVIAERNSITRAVWFGKAGLWAAVPFMLLEFWYLADKTTQDAVDWEIPQRIVTFLIAGLCSGLTYWAIAGRHSGSWKSNP
jgi:hypothetical protein